MLKKIILTLLLIFLPLFSQSQSFKISLESTPSTFDQYDPHLFVSSDHSFIVTWTDNRTGIYHAFAQWFNAQTLQKSGANMPFWGNNNLFFGPDSVMLSIKYFSREGSDIFPGTYFYTGRLYRGNSASRDTIMVTSGSSPVCGMGVSKFNYQFLFFPNNFVKLLLDGYFGIVRYDYRLHPLSSIDRFPFAPINFTASTFGNDTYGFIFVNDFQVAYSDTVYTLYYTLFDSRDSMIIQPKKILGLADFKTSDFYGSGSMLLPLASISLGDTTILAAFWNVKKRVLNYFRVFQSGQIDSVKTINLGWTTDRYEMKMRFAVLQNGQIRLILSGRRLNPDVNGVYVNAFYDFTSNGNFTGHAVIDSSMRISLNENGCYFTDDKTFYAPFGRHWDVYLGHYQNFVLKDQLKINDDVSGSNEFLTNILPKGENDFYVIYNKKHGNRLGRTVSGQGIPQDGEDNVPSGAFAFFKDGSHVRFWKKTVHKDILGFSLYNKANQRIKQDTIATNYDACCLSASVLQDQSFVLIYHNYYTDRTAVTIVASDGNIRGTFSFYNTDPSENARVFQMKNGECWLVWNNKGLKFSAESAQILSDVYKFSAPVAMVFDPGLFLLVKNQVISGVYYQAALITASGDTLTPTFPISHPYIYFKPYLLKLNEQKFMSLYTFDQKIMANVYALNGICEIESKVISQIDSGLIGNAKAAVNNDKILFAWQRTGRTGCGYDVDGAVEPLNMFTAIDKSADVQPDVFRLLQNYPNPFNSATVIPFEIPFASQVTLTIYNTLGQKIRSWHRTFSAAGNHQILWDGRNFEGSMVPSGIYFYQVKVGKSISRKKMLLVR